MFLFAKDRITNSNGKSCSRSMWLNEMSQIYYFCKDICSAVDCKKEVMESITSW